MFPVARFRTIVLFMLMTVTGGLAVAQIPPDLLTVAERSEFRSTSTYDEVISLVRSIADRSDRIQMSTLGQTVEGRDIPMLVIGGEDDPQTARRDEKLVALIYGNIHAGEVCGKEALLMLSRQIALADQVPEWLEEMVLLIVPIFNADGNERFAKTNRPGQNGPEEGMGQRPNAQGLDLNRDWMKAESPEIRAMLAAFRKWDPDLVIDTHTTNGSYHRYTMTYAGPKNPATSADLLTYVRDELLPEAEKRLESKTGFLSFPYGNFNREHTLWTTYSPGPRYSTNYQGLRHQVSILTEAYAYASYEDRVRSTLAFVESCLEIVSENRPRILSLREQAKQARGPVPIRSQPQPFQTPVTALGYVEEVDGQRVPNPSQPKDYQLKLLDDHVPTLVVERPSAYLIPHEYQAVIHTMQRHGLPVLELREEIQLEVEVTEILDYQISQRRYQNHQPVRINQTEQERVTQMIPAGTFVVPTDGPLGHLAVYLLEAKSDDGLVIWNAFDEAIVAQQPYPILRLMEIDPSKLLTVLAPQLPEERSTRREITYEYITGPQRPNLNGSPTRVTWLEDEPAYLQRRGGELMKVNAMTGQFEPYQRPQQPGNETRTSLLANRAQGNSRDRLTTMSPDGTKAAFVRENNLFVVDLETQVETQLTEDGNNQILNGVQSYIYYEELFNRSPKAFWWSPDSQKIAFLRFDDRPVPDIAIPNLLTGRQDVDLSAYPKPGDPNPLVDVKIANVTTGDVQTAKLDNYDQERLISYVGWYPKGDKAYAYVQDRVQTYLDVVTIDAQNGAVERLFRDQTEAWVESTGGLTFLDDGTFLFRSERTGWAHVYRYQPDGTLITAVTEGEFEVRDIVRVDEQEKLIYVSATKDNPIATNLYRVPLAGGELTRLTRGQGSHNTSLAPGADLFIDRMSTIDRPEQVVLCRLSDGGPVRMIDSNPVRDLARVVLADRKRFQIPTEDGFLMEAEVTFPPDIDPEKKYPVWLMTYAGPHAPTVRDDWSRGRSYDQALAQELGVIAFRVDPRSASGKGAISTWSAYKQLGIQELKDLEDAIDWLLETYPYADGDRVGISGYSYGGFMTSFAMTHSSSFASGFAGAPVTDWADYDTIYTERYMLTPEQNPQGYRSTSVVEAAGNLHGKLLLVHGLRDDNVAVQNSFKLIQALQRAGKTNFELMIYPSSRHGIGSAHLGKIRFEFIRRTLGGPRKLQESE